LLVINNGIAVLCSYDIFLSLYLIFSTHLTALESAVAKGCFVCPCSLVYRSHSWASGATQMCMRF